MTEHPLKQWRDAQRDDDGKQGISLEKAASRVPDGPITAQAWQRYENNRVPEPDVLRRICNLTGLTPNDFHRWAA